MVAGYTTASISPTNIVQITDNVGNLYLSLKPLLSQKSTIFYIIIMIINVFCHK